MSVCKTLFLKGGGPVDWTVSLIPQILIIRSFKEKALEMLIKNPIDMFWTSSIEPRIFLLYFLIQIGQGLPWSAVSLMLTRDIVQSVWMDVYA